MNYKKRRIKAGINFYTMVKELGIPEKKYKEVEEGKRNLEGNMLDKFMDIIRRKTEVNINTMIDIEKVNKWITSEDFKKDMKNYGYTQRTLAKELNLGQSTISHAVNGRKGVSDSFKLKLYDFLHNPLNKVIKNKDENKKEVKKSDDKDIKNWVIKNLNKKLKENKISQIKLAKELNVSNSTISHIICGNHSVSKKLAKKIYDYFNKKQKNDDMKIPKDFVNKEIKIDNNEQENKKEDKKDQNKDEKEIKKVTININNITTINLLKEKLIKLEKKNEKLKRQIMLYEKLIEKL